MSDDEQNNANKGQDAEQDDTGQTTGAASDDKQNANAGSQAEQADNVNSTDNSNATNDSGGDDDVIHVAKTPTSPALLTQLGHNRVDNQARALGAGHTGSAIFHTQRVTALALIPLGIWFVVGVIRMSRGTHAQAAAWLAGPIHAALMALFIVIALRHAAIGLCIIAEDYVRDETLLRVSVLAIQAAALVTGVASVAALILLGTR